MPNIKDNSEVGVRSNHDLGFNWLGSADFGTIVPFHWQELIGTDKVIKCRPEIEMQMLPLVSPTFGKLDIYVHYFFVPTRLLWKDFLDFYSGTGEGANAAPPYWEAGDFQMAYIIGNTSSGLVGDMNPNGNRPLFKHWTSFGLPPFFAANLDSGLSAANNKISLLPLRAYNQIWWDYYRDPELIPDSNKSIYIDTSSGHDVVEEGDTIKYIPRVRSYKDTWIAELFARNGQAPGNIQTGLFAQTVGNRPSGMYPVTTVPENTGSAATTLASQQLRTIEALTRLAERMSMSGKRQIDQLFSQYGIKPEWSKLNMCQYIGGAKGSVLVSDITSTADTALYAGSSGVDDGAPLGRKAGAGYLNFDELNVEFEAHEPGYLMGCFSVMPKVHFVQGLGKEWFRNSVNDWFRRELEHTGQTAVPRKEVGVKYYGLNNGPSYNISKNEETFAFTQPYYDYKRKMDVLAGDFMWYHATDASNDFDTGYDVAYMNSMGMYIDYPVTRQFDANSLACQGKQPNKIFFYQGASSVWSNSDDHFHLNIDVNCVINRPMDGYAVPTFETTEDPHISKANIGSSTVL